jgi:hemoglobin
LLLPYSLARLKHDRQTEITFNARPLQDWISLERAIRVDTAIAASARLDHAFLGRRRWFSSTFTGRPKMAQENTPAPETPALYDRLGGVYNIATVVDDLIDRVMTDARLNANPRVDEAHHRVSPAGFKYLVTEMVCWAAGGPQRYSGRPMGDSHRHLMITAGEWEAFMDDFQQTLDKFGVPQPEQDELKAIVESTREAIVVAPLQEGPAAAGAPR